MDNAGKKLFRFAAPDTECDEVSSFNIFKHISLLLK